MINIVCVLKKSSTYTEEWVYKLKRAVEKNTSIAYRFVCLSDVPLECDYYPLDSNIDGWWNKIQLFKPDLFASETIYFDLDVIISKSIDHLIESLRAQSSNFVMTLETPNISNSSIMYWRGDFSKLYYDYISSPSTYHNLYRKGMLVGDQAFISQNVTHSFLNDLLPKNYISWCKDYTLEVSRETGLLIFLSKKFKPHKFLEHTFIKENWE